MNGMTNWTYIPNLSATLGKYHTRSTGLPALIADPKYPIQQWCNLQSDPLVDGNIPRSRSFAYPARSKLALHQKTSFEFPNDITRPYTWIVLNRWCMGVWVWMILYAVLMASALAIVAVVKLKCRTVHDSLSRWTCDTVSVTGLWVLLETISRTVPILNPLRLSLWASWRSIQLNPSSVQHGIQSRKHLW